MDVNRSLFDATSRVYGKALQGTLETVKESFVEEGVNQSVVDELKSTWLMNLRNMGTIPTPTEENATLCSLGDRCEEEMKDEARANTEENKKEEEAEVDKKNKEQKEGQVADDSDCGSELSELSGEDIDEIIIGAPNSGGEAKPSSDCRSVFKYVRRRGGLYKMELANGLMQVDGREIIIHKAHAEFQWGSS